MFFCRSELSSSSRSSLCSFTLWSWSFLSSGSSLCSFTLWSWSTLCFSRSLFCCH